MRGSVVEFEELNIVAIEQMSLRVESKLYHIIVLSREVRKARLASRSDETKVFHIINQRVTSIHHKIPNAPTADRE